MAQEVGYFENNVSYPEGPFVITNPLRNGWRIEAELKGHKCPVLPDLSIYYLMESLGYQGKWRDKADAVRICDRLNALVHENRIVNVNNMWVAR